MQFILAVFDLLGCAQFYPGTPGRQPRVLMPFRFRQWGATRGFDARIIAEEDCVARYQLYSTTMDRFGANEENIGMVWQMRKLHGGMLLSRP